MNKHITDDIKAVFFDHDDTLVDTMGTKWAQHIFIASEYYGKNLSREEITEHWGKPLHELIGILYGTNDIEQAMEYNIKHHKQFPKGLFPGTIDTIKKLHASGKVIGIVTATVRLSFETDTKLHKFPMDLIDYTQTSEDTVFHKPDPRVFEPATKWLEGRGIKPSETIYIGDGTKDIEAALGAGYNFLGVETGLTTKEYFKRSGVKSVANISKVYI
jgi:phosphoglycolate phosphatase-like HAD superfamily hydrolase